MSARKTTALAEQRYIAQADLAKRWGCSPAQISRLVHNGTLEPWLLPGTGKNGTASIRVTMASVLRLEERGARTAPAAAAIGPYTIHAGGD